MRNYIQLSEASIGNLGPALSPSLATKLTEDATLQMTADTEPPGNITEAANNTPTELKTVESRCLTLDDDTPPDVIDEIRARLKWISDEYDRVNKIFCDAIIKKIKARGDVLLSNNVRLYVGGTNKYKARDTGKLLNAILMLGGGDVEAVENVLASGWFKKTEIQNLCDDTSADAASAIAASLQLDQSKTGLFNQLIDTIRTDKLKEGKPEGLQVDTGYRRGGAKSAKKPALNRGEYLK